MRVAHGMMAAGFALWAVAECKPESLGPESFSIPWSACRTICRSGNSSRQVCNGAVICGPRLEVARNVCVRYSSANRAGRRTVHVSPLVVFLPVFFHERDRGPMDWEPTDMGHFRNHSSPILV